MLLLAYKTFGKALVLIYESLEYTKREPSEDGASAVVYKETLLLLTKVGACQPENLLISFESL